MAKQGDLFSNKFYATVTESAANTLTFSEVQTNVEVFSKIAWVLHRLEWYLEATDIDKIIATADLIEVALASSNTITSLGLGVAAVIDVFRLGMHSLTGVGYTMISAPIIREFSGLPGGGLIIAPRPLYIGVKGTSLASAVSAKVRGYFTVKELSADEYLELVDFYRIVS